jgi:hypothetical protein
MIPRFLKDNVLLLIVGILFLVAHIHTISNDGQCEWCGWSPVGGPDLAIGEAIIYDNDLALYANICGTTQFVGTYFNPEPGKYQLSVYSAGSGESMWQFSNKQGELVKTLIRPAHPC